MRKNRNKGFTLMEVVVAIGLIAILSGLVLTSLSAIPQAKIKSTANIIKSEFVLSRDFAKTHGAEAEFSIKKTDDGIEIIRTGKNLKTETTTIDDGTDIFYKLTAEDDVFQLGKDTVHARNGLQAIKITDTLTMTFSQTNGAIIGPHMLDYIIVTNGNKSYKLLFVQKTGDIYFDYDVDMNTFQGNKVDDNTKVVKMPTFMINGINYQTVELKHTGETLQPEIIYDPTYIRISGVYRAIDRGEYQVSFFLKDPYKTEWEIHVPENAEGKEEYILTWTIK